jgi:hypothetical protein
MCSMTDMVSALCVSLMVVVCGVAAGFAVAKSQGGPVKLSEIVTARSTTIHGMELNATAILMVVGYLS